MANYSTSEFKSGLRILIDGNPCIIVENEFVKPGKGQAFNRVRIKNLKSGKTVDKTSPLRPPMLWIPTCSICMLMVNFGTS